MGLAPPLGMSRALIGGLKARHVVILSVAKNLIAREPDPSASPQDDVQ